MFPWLYCYSVYQDEIMKSFLDKNYKIKKDQPNAVIAILRYELNKLNLYIQIFITVNNIFLGYLCLN